MRTILESESINSMCIVLRDQGPGVADRYVISVRHMVGTGPEYHGGRHTSSANQAIAIIHRVLHIAPTGAYRASNSPGGTCERAKFAER